VCGISGQKKWTFQLCISQASQADRTAGIDNILRGITNGYARKSNYLEGRLSQEEG